MKGRIMQNKHLYIILFLLLLFSACASTTSDRSSQYRKLSPQEQAYNYRMQYVLSNPDLPPGIKQNIIDGRPTIGMTAEQVLVCWGNPADAQRSGDATGVREVWIYYHVPMPELSPLEAGLLGADQVNALYARALANRRATFLYFVNGIFSSFEER